MMTVFDPSVGRDGFVPETIKLDQRAHALQPFFQTSDTPDKRRDSLTVSRKDSMDHESPPDFVREFQQQNNLVRNSPATPTRRNSTPSKKPNIKSKNWNEPSD